MDLSPPIESARQPSGDPPVRPRRRVLRWIAISLAGIVTLLLSWPVVRISSETASLITPGMTRDQAERIVGAEPGWYDGVDSFSTNEPYSKDRHWMAWTGARGTLALTPDQNGRVGTVNFYPASRVHQSQWELLVERLTRSTERQWEWWWMYGHILYRRRTD